MKYADKLKDVRWQKKRLEIFKRDNFTCRSCYSHEGTMVVHHLSYNTVDPWDELDSDLITLCDLCHNEWHRIFDNNSDSIRTYLVSRLKNEKEIEEKQLDMRANDWIKKQPKPKVPNLEYIQNNLKK